MKPEPSRLRQEQQQAQQAEVQLRSQSQAAQEFGTAEEAIRFDAANTPAPDSIADRLKDSIAAEPKPVLPWWRRLFRGGMSSH
jgi:hypothetical protein